MSQKTIKDTHDNQDNEDGYNVEDSQKPRRQAKNKMATMDATIRESLSAPIDISDDEDSYQPSNDGNQKPSPPPDNSSHSTTGINALDYVNPNHPLFPRRSHTLDSAEDLRNRVRYHSAFWWDVIVAMHEQAQPGMAQNVNQTLRVEIAQLKKEIGALRKERNVVTTERNSEAELSQLKSKIARLQKEQEQDKAIIKYLEGEHRHSLTPSTREEEDIRRTALRSSTADGLHNNSKFPDAPLFSGDRASFDSWKDKILDKLANSAAQYPTEEHRIAYIKSRTDGTAYQQIRAQCQSDHPRPFQTAEDVLAALEKIYGDKNKRNRAINELRTLKMNKRHFDDFFADFARCTAEIGYSDDALVPLLENAISDELAGQVIGLKKPSDYYELIDFYRDIDHQMRDHEKRMANRTRNPRPAQQLDRPRTTRPTGETTTRPEGHRPTAAERTLLAQHGRCYKCGEHGHRIGECKNPQMKEMPRLPTRPQNKLNEATVDSDDDKTVVEGKEES